MSACTVSAEYWDSFFFICLKLLYHELPLSSFYTFFFCSSALVNNVFLLALSFLIQKQQKEKTWQSLYFKETKSEHVYEGLCLLEIQDQTWIPQVQERIELAKLGQGLKKLTFNADGDAQHIHIIISNFPVLDSCGCYTLLRLKENSRKLVAIDSPDCGITVSLLKDILRQAKLCICSLQCDVLTIEAEKFCSSDQSVSCYAIILR